MKPVSSLFIKIWSWFFLNLILVAAVLTAFFAFQPQMELAAVFGRQGFNRLRAAGMLIAHDLNRTPRANWSDLLARHAKIHQVDFVLALKDGSCFFSRQMDLPDAVKARVIKALQWKPPRFWPLPPPVPQDPQRLSGNPIMDPAGDSTGTVRRPRPARDRHDGDSRLVIRTRHPSLYWTGIRIPLGPPFPPRPALLLAVSDSITGNGFFFDPLPWMVVAAAVILVSALVWIPMVRHITRPLARMTHAAEKIAKGRFDVSIHEPRADEIGRLGSAVNHMTLRLAAFVKGQKRFLGDVAHELGSPIARIQFGLGVLEQCVPAQNRRRVADVMEDVDHLSKLVNELLAFSRAELKAETVKLETIDLAPVVQAAIARERTSAAEIVTQIDPDIRVVASAELLTRALANLLRNAVKYAAHAGPIVVSAEKRDNAVAIEVRDNGPGVPEEVLDQLFEPFFRPEPSRDRNSGGVGLGLAIVKTCVDTCQGTVSARNLEPNGFAVTISLTVGT